MLYRHRKNIKRRRRLINISDLKTFLHQKNTKQVDKLLLILASMDKSCQIKEMKDRARVAGLRFPATFNLSESLRNSKGLAIRTPQGWEITDTGKQYLRDHGFTKISPGARQVATELRAHLSTIKDEDTRSFVEEAIKCYEAELYRSAIVMSWIGAVAVLHSHIHAKHMEAFNREAKRMDPKWNEAKTTDDLGKMKENDLLERIATLSLIGKDVKRELKRCLEFRNSCGHPNSLRISSNTAAHHIEILFLNVFKKF